MSVCLTAPERIISETLHELHRSETPPLQFLPEPTTPVSLVSYTVVNMVRLPLNVKDGNLTWPSLAYLQTSHSKVPESFHLYATVKKHMKAIFDKNPNKLHTGA